MGRPLQDLEFSYRPVELRALLEQAYKERRAVAVKEISWATLAGEPRWLDLQIMPLSDSNGNLVGAAIAFIDVTRNKRLQLELEHTNQELETAYEELQSTNEELETTNEELQSTVEEMETINEELIRRSTESNRANVFLESIMTSLRGGVIVVNPEMDVLIWNRRSEDLWGLRADEALNKNLLILDIGHPVERLKPLVRACLAGNVELQEENIDATNRRGKAIRCNVTCTPLRSQGGSASGVILIAEEQGEG